MTTTTRPVPVRGRRRRADAWRAVATLLVVVAAVAIATRAPDEPAVPSAPPPEEPAWDGTAPSGGSDEPTDPAAASRTGPGQQAPESGQVTFVYDGDTVEVAGLGTIRIIGIDTPEAGRCGADEARAALNDLALNKIATLTPGKGENADRYGRLLRYVDVGGIDTGRTLIADGLAVARYDSRDGYGPHPREADYVSLDLGTPPLDGCGATTARTLVAAPPAAANTGGPAGSEPWTQPGPDLADIGHPVRITGPDYHRLDRDHDGWGCEDW
jgi:endonuclease YncB( thermonuclease family)